MNTFINAGLYTGGWFLCVWLAGLGYNLLPAAILLSLIIFQLVLVFTKDRAVFYQDLILCLFAITCACLLEMIFLGFHFIAYKNVESIFPPLWLLAIYPLFALTVNHSFFWITRFPIIAIPLGWIGGPLNYRGGQSLGAVQILIPMKWMFLGMGAIWGLFLYLLIKFDLDVKQAVQKFSDEKDQKTTFEVLYDGDCPICKREMDSLKKRDLSHCMHFINIADSNYEPKKHSGITFEKAMEKIHGVTNQGRILTGVEVFGPLYARTGHPLLSILFHLKSFSPILQIAYRIFASNRLRITGRK